MEAEVLSRRKLKEIWAGLDMNHKTCLKVLKRDKVFIDYFNAFLSLPAFSRPLYFDMETLTLLEIYKECNVPIVGVTIQIPQPEGEVKNLLETWLIKSRLNLFLTTSLYMEYLLCKELLRVCGAIPYTYDSEEELSESDTEAEDAPAPSAKERSVLDLAGMERSSQMSTGNDPNTPLIPTPVVTEDVASATEHTENTADAVVNEDDADPDKDLITISRSSFCASVHSIAPSLSASATEIKLQQTSEATLTEEQPTNNGSSSTFPSQQFSSGPDENMDVSIAPNQTEQLSVPTALTPNSGAEKIIISEKLEPREVTKSVADMIPDSQSDIVKPQIWQEIYKNRCSPLSKAQYPDAKYRRSVSEIYLSEQDKLLLIGSVTAMDKFRTFLSSTAGEHLLNLWLDISLIQRLDALGSETEAVAEHIRDLYDKYKNRLSSPIKLSLSKRDMATLKNLKEQVLRKLQFYWLPRYFYEKVKNRKTDGPLRLELDEEVLKLPFLPSAAVHRSYPSDINNLTKDIRDLENWKDIFKEQDKRILSGRLRTLSASIIRNNRDGFVFGVRSDKNAGSPFKTWLKEYDKSLVDVLNFMEDVNVYQIHEERKADRGILKRLGWRMWHQYMAPGAVQSLNLGPSITSDIRIALVSTKDFVPHTTFTTAKGNLMMFLKQAWKLYIQDDYEDYLHYRPDIMEQVHVMAENRIKQIQNSKIHTQRRRYNRVRHRRGKKKKIHTVFDSASEGELDEEDFNNVIIPTLEDSLSNRVAMDKFNTYATRSLNGDRIQMYSLWNDIKSYLEINKQSNKQLRVMQAEHIYRTYFVNKERKTLGLPLDMVAKLEKERPNTPLLSRAITVLQPTMEKAFDDFVQSLPLTIATLQRRATVDDMASNISQHSFILGGKKRGKGAKSKKVSGRATPTKELYNRLLSLLSSVHGVWPEELLLFEKYLGQHGADDGFPLIVNDLHFWVEVQRFKDMQHDNSDNAFILRKLRAIIDCYLDPQTPSDVPPEKSTRQLPPLSPPPSPTLSAASKGPNSSPPVSPSQSKSDLIAAAAVKKIPWNQRKQVDLPIDLGQKLITRLATPGGYLDKDLSIYDDAQKIVLKELVPFYAGFYTQENGLQKSLSECKLCDLSFTPRTPYPCSQVNKKWLGTPQIAEDNTYELPSIYSAMKPKQYNINTSKDHFTFTLEHGVTWAKHVDEDMISANSDEALITLPTRQSTKVKIK